MALQLKSVPAASGSRWIGDAWRLFMRRPLAFMSMAAVVGLLSAAVQIFPPLSLFAVLIPPLLSLGFMVAGQSALLDGPVHPRQFIEPLRSDARRRRALIVLSLSYGAAVLLIALVLYLVSGSVVDSTVATAPAAAGAASAPVEIDLQRPEVLRVLLTGLLLVAMLSIPYWHAPALVHWGGQGVAQALFSSTLAVWRCRGAFLVYAVAGGALAIGALMVVSLAAGLIGAPSLVAVLAVPVALSVTSVFYLSVLFSFNDSFGGKAVPPMDDDYTRPDPG
jgi:hypothetical protein